MENELRLYESSYIVGAGAPVIVITGYSTVTSDLYAEYFLFIRGDSAFFDWRRVHYVYNYPAPHPVTIDVNFMMGLALEDAQMSLKRYVDQKWLQSRNDKLFQAFELKESSEALLLRLYLLDENAQQLEEIKKNADSPKLRQFLKDILALPKLVP